jgi:hypothetical protein
MAMQSAKIQHSWNQIKLRLLNFIIPSLEIALDFLTRNVEQMKFALKWFTPMGLAAQLFDKIAGSIADNWWSISHAIRDAFEWVKRIARSISGGFLDAIGFGPDDPVNRPAPTPSSFAPFSMVPASAGPLSNEAFTQNNHYYISGLTAEQMDARARRQADTAHKGGLR